LAAYDFVKELSGLASRPKGGAFVIEASETDDALIIAEVLAGRPQAFSKLVTRYQDRLFQTAFHITRSREEAEDVVQEALVQAFVKLGTFQRQSAFFTWLYRIALNAAITRRRRKRVDLPLGVDAESGICEPADPHEGPEERILREERSKLLYAALGALSEEHRIILVLRELEGFCYESICEALDLPIGTVRSRLHRARLHLADQLKGVLHENPSPES
jgi:RNA polymerase sigma-70 factor, ECF subfamily